MIALAVAVAVFLLARRQLGRWLRDLHANAGPTLLERRAREGVLPWQSR